MRSKLLTFALLPLSVLIWWLSGTSSASAASFNYTDHLMDDSVFRASSTMSENDIQNFLAGKNSGLANYAEIEDCGPVSGPHHSYYATYYSCGITVRASRIIYDASQAYGINPEVILATLQKEQSLVTDPTNPASNMAAINCAMGYNSCNGYGSFFLQVDNGAWQFRTYYELGSGNNWWGFTPANYPCRSGTSPTHIYPAGDNPNFYAPGLLPGNDVAFFDYYGVAYTHFVIPNISTAGLYCYTPHVYPGSPGTYYSGSYWFVYYFNLWFVPYQWSPAGQSAYTDQTKTTAVDLTTLKPGQRVYVKFQAYNNGYMTWTNSGSNPIRVATSGPPDRMSAFCDATWLGCNRPANMIEASVAPGQTGTFEFWYQAPNTTYAGFEQFRVMAESLSWMNDPQMSFYTVVKPIYSWSLVSQYSYTDNTKTTPAGITGLNPGQRVYIGFKALNTGNMTWTNSGSNPIRVATSGPPDRMSAFCDATWLGCNRPANMIEASVAPGQTGTFEFWYQAPTSRSYIGYEQFRPMAEGLAWMNDPQMSFYTVVNSPVYSWSLVSQYAYANSGKTSGQEVNLTQLHRGDRVYIGFKALNTGNMTWTNSGSNPIRVATSGPPDRMSAFCDATWLGCNRPANMIEASVAPGQTGTFEFWYQAPTSRSYIGYEQFRPMAEGLAWMNDPQMSFYTVVN